MALTETQIQELYVAYFGRPADPDGKDYWMSSAAGAPTDRAFASHMHAQSEFQDAYGSMSTQAQVNQLYQNLFNRDADATGLAYWTGQITQGTLKLADIAVNLIHAAKNPNSGNTTQGTADALALSNKVAAAKEFTGDVKADATALLAYTSDDANAFDTAKTFINGISSTAHTSAEVDTQVTTIKDSYTENTANKGTTYTLTSSADNFTGGRLNDTFNGLVDSDASSGETFTAADIIDGGVGTDTLSWTVSPEGTTSGWPTGAAISNIEIFKIRNVEGAAVDVELGQVSGETKAVNNLSTSDVNFESAATGTVLDIVGNTTLTNGATTIDYVAAATEAKVYFKDGTVGAGAVTVDGAGITNEYIYSTGAANVTGAYTVSDAAISLDIDATTDLTFGDINSNVITTLTVSGAGAVDTGTAAGTALATVTASSNTGGLTFVSGTFANTTTQNETTDSVDTADLVITGGSGNDSITLADLNDSIETSVTLGAGDDTLVIAEAITNSTGTNVGDVLNGGAGTDTLSATNALTAAITTATNTVSNFEELTQSDELDENITPGNVQSGINVVNLAATTNNLFDDASITFATGGGTVNLTGTVEADGAITVVSSGDSTTDTITINNQADEVDGISGENIIATDTETLIINTTGLDSTADTDTTAGIANTVGTIALSVDTGGTSTVKFTGAQQITTGEITADNIDASGLTGTTGFINSAAAVTLTTSGTLTFTGSDGADTIIGDADDNNVISTGAGNDIITGGNEVDTLTGGAGNDTINMGGSAASTISGGAGNDTIVSTTDLLYGQTITGGAGTDTLSITDDGVNAANGSVVSGFEVLNLAGAADSNQNINLDNFGNNTFTSVNLDNVVTTITDHSDEAITVDATMTVATSITADTNATVTTDTITLNTSATDYGDNTGAITLVNIESVTITTDDTEDAGYETADYDIVANSATTLTITGDTGIDFENGGGSSFDALVTLDASGMTNTSSTEGIIFTSQNATVGAVTSYTGSAAADTFTGLATSDDTFSGGLGVDTLVYDGRTDTFTGGGGNDVFDIDAFGTNTGSAYLTITDLTVGDTINFTDVDAGADADGAIANVTLGAKHTLGSSATLANYLDAACGTAINNTTDTMLDWFYFGGNTFITVDNSVEQSYFAGQDGIIKLTGEIDLSTSTTSGAVLTVVAV